MDPDGTSVTPGEATRAPHPEGRSGTKFVVFFVLAFVAMALFFLFVVARAAPEAEGVAVDRTAVEDPTGRRSPSGSAGGAVAILLTVGGVGAVGAVAYRGTVRQRRARQDLDHLR